MDYWLDGLFGVVLVLLLAVLLLIAVEGMAWFILQSDKEPSCLASCMDAGWTNHKYIKSTCYCVREQDNTVRRLSDIVKGD
jgi:hypothetical protein